MLTDDQLADQLRARLHCEVAGIRPRTDLLASLRRRQARRSLALRLGIAATPVTAAAAAVAVMVAAGGGGAEPTKSIVLTAATVQRMASASRLALAQSGRAKIAYLEIYNGSLQVSGTDSIAFAGKNWNDTISQTFPAIDGQPSHTQSAINRIVSGQFYLYVKGRDGRLGWYRDTNPSGHPSMRIPDPRTLFGMLDPSARFEVIGHRVVGGVRLTELRATKPPRLHALGWLPGVTPGAQVTSLTVRADGHHVVHQMSVQVKLIRTVNPIYLNKSAGGTLEVVVPSKAYLKEARAMFRKARKHQHVLFRVDPSVPATVRHDVQVTSAWVTFSSFGKPQVITAPRHAVAEYSRG